MGAIVLTLILAIASPLKTTIDGRHIFAGQPVRLTVHVVPEERWRALTIAWYDASGFLVSSSTRELGERELGGQFFSTIRANGDPGMWQVVTELHSTKLEHRAVERFEVLVP